MSGSHEFTGIAYGVADRPCTTCGKADRDPIHAARAAAPPVEPRSDPEDGPNPWEPAVPPPNPVAGLREALAAGLADAPRERPMASERVKSAALLGLLWAALMVQAAFALAGAPDA